MRCNLSLAILDDNPADHDLIRAAFHKADAAFRPVYHFERPGEFQGFWSDGAMPDPDAVLLDIHLRDLDGIALLRRLRRQRLRSRTRCFFWSAEITNDELRSMPSDCTFMLKPETWDDFQRLPMRMMRVLSRDW